jgi:hypothetical protein
MQVGEPRSGFPGLILDPSGPIEVYIFESSDLPDHWSRLDEYEGPGYRRVVTQVSTADGELSAYNIFDHGVFRRFSRGCFSMRVDDALGPRGTNDESEIQPFTKQMDLSKDGRQSTRSRIPRGMGCS